LTKLNRRGFLGAAALGITGVALRPIATFASTPNFIRPALLARARAALETHRNRIAHRDAMAIADFLAPSREPRLHLLDIASGQVSTLLVAHGLGSDPDNTGWVQRFSNRPGSNASSNGSFLTGDTYIGKHGRSCRLIGLDPENDEAEPRAIVIHAASYVSRAMAREQGRVGRSQGCFAVAADDLDQVLARLGAGRLLFADKV
jgi:L,D-transpeptidase catalytic domain